MSLIHIVWEGGVGDFHLVRIRRLASNVAKAIRSALSLGKGRFGMPNTAVIRALGSISVPVTSDKVLKIEVQ